ncbi:hypothetical protein RvY_12866 [Ramazzottius varieornatus]|uniref:Peptidase S1 domain-containing protein n=1 Tax=Ramazzottius varieornatus TaxID=947166 RepID=A0A1D1VN75_RAMVA|nr:hypothetical protein RvY_12866 [Ramazzottius varieornatus]
MISRFQHLLGRWLLVLSAASTLHLGFISCAQQAEVKFCGRPAITPSLLSGHRILGGESAIPGSWPWQVRIGERVKGGISFFCGGTILNPLFILTAGHCFPGPTVPSRYVIRVAEYNMSAAEEVERDYSVVAVFKHPYYSSVGAPTNDISVIRLTYPMVFTERISAVCLPAANDDPEPGKQCVVTGWGRYLDQFVAIPAPNLNETGNSTTASSAPSVTPSSTSTSTLVTTPTSTTTPVTTVSASGSIELQDSTPTKANTESTSSSMSSSPASTSSATTIITSETTPATTWTASSTSTSVSKAPATSVTPSATTAKTKRITTTPQSTKRSNVTTARTAARTTTRTTVRPTAATTISSYSKSSTTGASVSTTSKSVKDIPILLTENGKNVYKYQPALLQALNFLKRRDARLRVLRVADGAISVHQFSDNPLATHAEVLQQAVVPILDRRNCSTYWKSLLKDNMICTMRSADEAEPCKGDSGGPLVCRNGVGSDAYWTLDGIISYGAGCGGKKPAVYTRVSLYLKWIEKVAKYPNPVPLPGEVNAHLMTLMLLNQQNHG